MKNNSLSKIMDAFAVINPYLTAAHIRTFLYVAERKIMHSKRTGGRPGNVKKRS